MKSSREGRLVDIDHTAHNYQIEFKDPDTLKCKTAWFKVDDLTSLTKENKRQRIAQEQSCGGKHWVLFVISVANLCIYIYVSVCNSQVLGSITSRFSGNVQNYIRHYQKQVHQARTPIFIFGRTRTFSEDNWEEETHRCRKQKNEKGCGVFTRLLAKNLIFAKSTEDIEQVHPVKIIINCYDIPLCLIRCC